MRVTPKAFSGSSVEDVVRTETEVHTGTGYRVLDGPTVVSFSPEQADN